MAQPPGQPPGPEIPASIRNASLLLWGLVGLMAVRTLLTIVFLDDLVDAYANSLTGGDQLPRALVEDGAPAYVPIALFSLVVFGGLLALCAHFVTRGAPWARIVATMFGSLAALGGLLVLLQPSTLVFTVLGLLNACLAVAAVVMLFSRESNAFFGRKRAARRRLARGQSPT